MPKSKYYFDTQSLKYEKVILSTRKKLLKALGFLSAVAVFAAIVLIIGFILFDSPKEKQLKRELAQMKLQYDIMEQRMDQASAVLSDLQQRDDNIYRVIFESEPIPASVRAAGYGGINRYRSLEAFDNAELMIKSSVKLDQLSKRLYVQSKSFDEVFEMAKTKAKMLAAIPAIQPISNKDLTRFSSGFGYRIHPIYKTSLMHTGCDFTAPTGTEIYATGDGVVKLVENKNRGYGHHVVIDHGYGYNTLYGHMSKVKASRGQKIKRGDVIGYVGSTGTSTAPHLHYEVHKNGKKIDPINFFYNDLNSTEYERMLEISTQKHQSFD